MSARAVSTAPLGSPSLPPKSASSPPVRGASIESLQRSAGAFLDALPWEGPAPNPDTLDAASYLAWL